MKVKDMAEALDLIVLAGENGLERVVSGGYVSDLLSDVMGRAEATQVWITLQTHKNVMAVASLKDLAAVILVNGQRPDEDMAQQAAEEGIPVLGTTLETFEISGRLYNWLRENASLQG